MKSVPGPKPLRPGGTVGAPDDCRHRKDGDIFETLPYFIVFDDFLIGRPTGFPEKVLSPSP